MRIIISEWQDQPPVVLERARAVLVAADEGSDRTGVCLARGEAHLVGRLAASMFISLRRRMGDPWFLAAVGAALTEDGIEKIVDLEEEAPR